MEVPFSSTPLCTVENRDVCVHYAISFKPRLLVSKNLSRVMHLYGARFSLIIELVKDHRATIIGRDSIEAAIALAEWFRNEISRVHLQAFAEEEDEQLLAMVDIIHRRGGETTARELAKAGPRKLRGKTEEVEALLDRIEDKGWGSWRYRRSTRGGRPARLFRLLIPEPVNAQKHDVVAPTTLKTLRKREVSFPGPVGNCESTSDEENDGDSIVRVTI
jgi:hypothetical protein